MNDNKYMFFAECYINQLVENEDYSELKAILKLNNLSIDQLLEDSLISNEFRNKYVMHFNLSIGN
ncbi:MAG: hypothetical protein JEZ05_08215 [Tenericutes bacterium]|nr:hypothetical protein [Mycoplasmatota bacterium]